jgi:protein involved in polysaccharide export with SLBB domain
VTTDPEIPTRWLSRLLLVLLATLVSCGSFEDKRIRELLHEKGFGTRASGDATRENYIGGQDVVQFLIPPEALLFPGYERLAELTVQQPVAIDGTIFLPYVGPVYVLGRTEAEVAALVRTQLRSVLRFDVEIQARIVFSRKFFYAIGETLRKGPIDLLTDMTLFDAMFFAGWTNLANLGRVYLIRPDAEHPLVIDINVREMMTTGYTRANIVLRERDILYVPPTILGALARLLQRLFEPVALVVQTMLGFAQVTWSYDILVGNTTANGTFFRF